MMFQEYDVVRLKAVTLTIPLPSGTEGTVLIVFQSDPMAYLVEFVDLDGETLGIYTAEEKDLESSS
jgi:hypothetical protein